ncbi:ABC transporter permease [Spirosoma rigui]|uniref:ABC transporter permease n=1 Tax=Spirosoma rigui TaxID=564064 RepID=UPI0009B184BE|nr:ABC transporter permease [Spirosoma rigui]
MLRNYLLIAWRNLRHQRLHSAVSIGSLAIALTASLLMLLWVQNELRFDTDQPASKRIFLITNQHQSNKARDVIGENSPYPLASAMARQLPQVELVTSMARSQKNDVSLRINDTYFTEEYMVYVDQNWFSMFHYDVVQGSTQSFLAHPFSLLLTQSKAKKLFGNANAAGKHVRIDSTDYVVRAIVKDNPVNSSFQFDVLIPLSSRLQTARQREEANTWLYPTHKTFVRLRDPAEVSDVTAGIARLYKANRSANDLTPALLALPSLHVQANFDITAFDHTQRSVIDTFALLAVVLLVAACVNYVNLAIAKTGMRTKEIGVRKIIGANRSQLFYQLMAESVLMSLLAFGLAVLLMQVFLPEFNAFTGKQFSLDLTSWALWKLMFGTWFGMLLLISLYPALLLSSVNPLSLFRGKGALQLSNTTIQKGLIVVQFSVTVILVIGVIVVYRQVSFMQHQHNAYNRSQLLTVQVPQEHYAVTSFEQVVAHQERLLTRLEALKQALLTQTSINQVARTNLESVVDHGNTTSGGVDWDNRDPDFQPGYVHYGVDPDFQSIMKFTFVQGRWFDKRLPSDKDNTVLNEAAVRQFGLTPPVLGKRFNKGVIIGVVKDFFYQKVQEPIGPVVITANSPNSGSFLIETQPGQAVSALNQTLDLFKQTFPNAPLFYSFMDDEFDTLYRRDQKSLQFMALFAGLSILISCLGLLGIATLSTEQRTKEIGIRKVLGASVVSIIALLSKGFLTLVGLAIVIASPIAWYVTNRWLQDFAHKIDLAWWMFALAGLLTVIIALLTVGLQSAKAALANPVRSLRTE